MIHVVPVRLFSDAKPHDCNAGTLTDLRPHEKVIAQTDMGSLVGMVLAPPRPVPRDLAEKPNWPVRRLSQDDEEKLAANRLREREAFAYAVERIEAFALPMKIVRVEYTLQADRITFYFTADHRVDFRRLLRDLHQRTHARVLLQQIGARDGARMSGGVGPCGREACCTSWLGETPGVSMARLRRHYPNANPAQLTGLCGRLRCCLVFELNGQGTPCKRREGETGCDCEKSPLSEALGAPDPNLGPLLPDRRLD